MVSIENKLGTREHYASTTFSSNKGAPVINKFRRIINQNLPASMYSITFKTHQPTPTTTKRRADPRHLTLLLGWTLPYNRFKVFPNIIFPNNEATSTHWKLLPHAIRNINYRKTKSLNKTCLSRNWRNLDWWKWNKTVVTARKEVGIWSAYVSIANTNFILHA